MIGIKAKGEHWVLMCPPGGDGILLSARPARSGTGRVSRGREGRGGSEGGNEGEG